MRHALATVFCLSIAVPAMACPSGIVCTQGNLPAVQGVPVDSGATWIKNLYAGPFCNKVILTNGQAWAIAPGDWNAAGRWAQIVTMYENQNTALALKVHDHTIQLKSVAAPDFIPIVPMHPDTPCDLGDGSGIARLPNPAQIIDGNGY